MQVCHTLIVNLILFSIVVKSCVQQKGDMLLLTPHVVLCTSIVCTTCICVHVHVVMSTCIHVCFNSRGVCMASSDSAVECKQFCEQQDLQTCHCTGDDQCRICCRDGTTSCKPYLPLNDLPDESFCEGGTCQLVCS